jgi:hypothetical protein
VARLDEVVLVRKVTFQLLNESGTGIVPDFHLQVRQRGGTSTYFAGAEDDVNRLLFELVSRLPWVLSGADERWDRLWQADRGNLLDGVAEQRRQIQARDRHGLDDLVRDKVRRAQERSAREQGRPPKA